MFSPDVAPLLLVVELADQLRKKALALSPILPPGFTVKFLLMSIEDTACYEEFRSLQFNPSSYQKSSHSVSMAIPLPPWPLPAIAMPSPLAWYFGSIILSSVRGNVISVKESVYYALCHRVHSFHCNSSLK